MKYLLLTLLLFTSFVSTVEESLLIRDGQIIDSTVKKIVKSASWKPARSRHLST